MNWQALKNSFSLNIWISKFIWKFLYSFRDKEKKQARKREKKVKQQQKRKIQKESEQGNRDENAGDDDSGQTAHKVTSANQTSKSQVNFEIILPFKSSYFLKMY